MTRITLQPVFGYWITSLLILLLSGAIFLFSLKSNRLSRPRRVFLLVLRFVALAVLSFILLRPSAVLEESRSLPASLAILVDDSASMGIQDGPGGESRFDSIRRLFDDSGEELTSLEKKLHLEILEFDETLKPLTEKERGRDGKIPLSETPEGEGTAIGPALRTVFSRTSGKRLLGVILLSDGTEQSRRDSEESTQETAFHYRDARIPVFTVPVGSNEGVEARKDIALTEFHFPESVFAGNEFVVSGQVHAVGFKGTTIPITLSIETSQGELRPISTMEVTPDLDDQTLPYRFSTFPEEPGERKVVVSIPTKEGELLAENNVRTGFVRITKGGISVLVLEGTRRFEDKFLRMALESTAEIHVDYWRAPDPKIQGSGLSKENIIRQETESRPSLTETFLKEGDYSVIILGNLDASLLKEEEMTAIKREVERGRGLIALGGPRTLSAGGYAETPLADLFPVRLDPTLRFPVDIDLERFEKNKSPEERIYDEGEFRAMPTEAGSVHYLTRLSPNPTENRAIWDRLPPLNSVLRIDEDSVKTSATILLEGIPLTGRRSLATRKPVPLLLTHFYGNGRVTLLTTDSTWRWSMGSPSDEFQRFWRQMILWSSSSDELKEGEIAVQFDRPFFSSGEPVDLHVRYRPLEGVPFDSIDPAVSIISPSGKSFPLPLTPDDRIFEGSFMETTEPGDYRVHVEMKDKNGKPLHSADARFYVEKTNPELENPVASPGALANLATITGGRSVTPDEFRPLLREILDKKEKIADTIRIKTTLYDQWPIFLFFLSLLTLEWFLRKKWGLV